MKSVLIGADILKLENEYKLLEINTDADLFLPDIPYLDLDPLFSYLTTNAYTRFVIIYKKKHIATAVLQLFESKCNENSITFNSMLIMDNSVTIPAIIEEDNTFYLRCAYDVTAIIDDTYCRDKSEVTKLLFDSENQSILPKTRVKHSGDGSIYDNLTDIIDNGNSPNIIVKKILPDFDKVNYPAFYNIKSSTDLDALKESIPDDVMIQEFKINNNLTTDNQISDVIRMTVILLSDVETMIPLGCTTTNNQLPLNTDIITYTDNKLDKKWKSMYFSNPNLLGYGVPGTYKVIKIVDDVEQMDSIENLLTGDIIKAVKLSNLSTSASMQETLDWYTNSNISDVISYETASVHFITKTPFEGWLSNISYSNGDVSGSSLLSNSEILLISSSTNNKIKFETAYDTKINDLVITTHNLLLPITQKENVWYSGSIVILDIEPADVFVAGTNTNEISKNNVGNILLHNKCAWSGFCCFSEDTLISTKDGNTEIQKIEVGQFIWSFNFVKNEKELKEVLEIQSPIHDDIVTIEFNNGIIINNTFDHPFYNENGKLISYNPSKTMDWYKGEILQMEVGNKCIDINGNLLEIKSITENIKPIQTYTLFVKDNKNFYANSVLVYDEQK
jgi:hypothetical protein